MMTAAIIRPLGEQLPPLRGRVQAEAVLAPQTWFRVGGPAEALVRPADTDDLCDFLRALPHGVPVTVIVLLTMDAVNVKFVDDPVAPR